MDPTNPTNTLVTGGSGYFGSLLRDRLRASGHAVAVFDLMDADDRPPDVAFFQGDIRNFNQIRQALDRVEVVYHCVAQVPLARDPALFRSVNIQGTENLLKAALDAGVRKIVLLSSSAVFGIPEKNPVDETAEPHPAEEYGQAKLEGERLAEDYSRRYGLDVTVIRPRTILGHGRLGIFQILFDWVARGKNVYVLGRGDNVYQFVHADDLADACMRAADRPGFAVYHIGAERFGTMRESLQGLIEHAGTGSRVRSLPMRPAVTAMELLSGLRLLPFAAYHWLMYGRSLYFDVSRAKRELSWQPRWGNVEMLCQSYDWYLAHRAEVAKAGGSVHRSPVRQGILSFLRWIS
ncbi:MAG: NAD-dependent epimerase/dehydratase family protein [Acidobacteria bacterium]|nr:NAD-dependent epimerase/dehydratase family protein [Acidobacteriota bacterium]